MYRLMGRIIETLVILVLLVVLVYILLSSFEAMADEKPHLFASDQVCQGYAAKSTPDLDRCLKCVQLSGFWNFGTVPVHNTIFFVHGVPVSDELHTMGITQSIPAMLGLCTKKLEKDFNALGGNPLGYQ